MRKFLICILSSLIFGCTTNYNYKRPLAPISKKFPEKGIYKDITYKKRLNIEELKWNNFFLDTKLKRIIEISLKNNRDLKQAVLKVEYAKQYYGIREADLYPSLYLSAGGSKQRIPDDLSFTKRGYIEKKYAVNLGIVNWEIDLFGRIRSLKKQALEEFFAAYETRKAAQISLISEIARTYFTLASNIENLKIAEITLQNRKELYKLIESQYELGIATEIDLERAKSQVENAKLVVFNLKEEIEKGKNILNLLAGKTLPGELFPDGFHNPVSLKPFFPGLSSEILLNRPDIMAVEHELKASYANIGVARALLFPRISLTSLIGTASDELSGLFSSGSKTWNIAMDITSPIFNLTAWKAYKLSKVQRKILLTKYERTIQSAFKEVLDLLTTRVLIDKKIKAQSNFVKSLERTYELAIQKFNQGIDSYLSVLDAQRTLLSGKLKLNILKLQKITNHILLYAAFGGGGS